MTEDRELPTERVARLMQAPPERRLENATELAWAWSSLSNDRLIVRDRDGALAAAEAAVEAIRPLAAHRGTGSRAAQDLIYLLGSLADRFMAVNRADDALSVLLEARELQVAQAGRSAMPREEIVASLACLAGDIADARRAVGDYAGALESAIDGLLNDTLATMAVREFVVTQTRRHLRQVSELLPEPPSASEE
jgi:hypothetical protein